jgi:hypothetical protein
MDGPAASHSDNLNPWQWKDERAPRSKNTAPAAQVSETSFQKTECLETDYVMVPASAVDKLEGYVPVDRLTAKRILEQSPAAQASLNIQERGVAKENRAAGLVPLIKGGEVLAPEVAPCSQNTGPVLEPIAAPDTLEGYEPQYFLKEDGR